MVRFTRQLAQITITLSTDRPASILPGDKSLHSKRTSSSGFLMPKSQFPKKIIDYDDIPQELKETLLRSPPSATHYKCSQWPCIRTFPNEKNLKSHYKYVHPNANSDAIRVATFMNPTLYLWTSKITLTVLISLRMLKVYNNFVTLMFLYSWSMFTIASKVMSLLLGSSILDPTILMVLIKGLMQHIRTGTCMRSRLRMHTPNKVIKNILGVIFCSTDVKYCLD